MRSPDNQKALQTHINNALSVSLKFVDPSRKKYLANYARALLAPLLEHVDSEDLDLDAKDAVFILLSLGLIMQTKVTGNTKIPTLGEAAALYTE